MKQTFYRVSFTNIVEEYTEQEFRNFIEIAVINNKDIRDFKVELIFK